MLKSISNRIFLYYTITHTYICIHEQTAYLIVNAENVNIRGTIEDTVIIFEMRGNGNRLVYQHGALKCNFISKSALHVERKI